jgi:glycine C-acetyltransferase
MRRNGVRVSDPPGSGETAPIGAAEGEDAPRPVGPDLLRRWDVHHAHWDARLAAGLDPTARMLLGHAGPEARGMTRGREPVAGVNFASTDHLSLAAHPALLAAAAGALARHGTHAGGSAAAQGGSAPLLQLEERLADLLCCREATVFPTGWAAGFGVVRTLVGEDDHVLLDALASPCLREAAQAATRNLHRLPHGATEIFLQRLERLRAAAPRAGILVLAESVMALDASVPALRCLRDGCRRHGATLLVRLGHDFGATGDGGLGFLGREGLIGETDVVAGSLAGVFAAGGGFVASNAPGLKQALRLHASTLFASAALSPVQAAIALAAIGIVASAEGAQRRRRLAANVARLREGLLARAFQLPGEAGPVVPVLLGEAGLARRITRAALAAGALVDLVEHPAVSRGGSRWPLRVLADHTAAHVDRMVEIAVAAREQSRPDGIPGAGRGPRAGGPKTRRDGTWA